MEGRVQDEVVLKTDQKGGVARQRKYGLRGEEQGRMVQEKNGYCPQEKMKEWPRMRQKLFRRAKKDKNNGGDDGEEYEDKG